MSFAIIAVCWLCCNGVTQNNNNSNQKPLSSATLISGTSTNTSNSSTEPTTCNSTALICRLSATNAIKRAFLPTTRTPPPPPRIPLPKAPQNNVNSAQLLPPNDMATTLKRHTKSQQLIYNNDLINSPLIWMPSQQQQRFDLPLKNATDTLDRRYRPQQQSQQTLYRTTRADDEMSRLSSNIYGRFFFFFF